MMVSDSFGWGGQARLSSEYALDRHQLICAAAFLSISKRDSDSTVKFGPPKSAGKHSDSFNLTGSTQPSE